eukprot:8292959-Pyramimonas_sp.AAC.1
MSHHRGKGLARDWQGTGRVTKMSHHRGAVTGKGPSGLHKCHTCELHEVCLVHVSPWSWEVTIVPLAPAATTKVPPATRLGYAFTVYSVLVPAPGTHNTGQEGVRRGSGGG